MKECLIGKEKTKGFVTAEILIAFVVICFSLSGAILVVFGNESLTLDSSLSREAKTRAEENVFTITPFTATSFLGLESRATTTTADGRYDENFSVSDKTPCVKQVRETLSWGKDIGRTHFQNLSTYFFSPEIQKMFGDSCAEISEKDWHTATSSGVVLFPLGSLMTSGDVLKRKFFLGSSNAIIGSPTFFAVDVSNSSSPSLLSQFTLGASVNALDVAGNVAYLAMQASTTQLQVIDISDAVHPTLVAIRTLPGVAGARPEGFSIFYFDQKVYVGTKRTAGHEFHIYDVSNPANPVWQGSLEVNHNINAISVRANVAYLATSGNIADLIILDVSDSTNPRRVFSLDLAGSQDGKSLYILGNKLYLGRFRSTRMTEPEFYILDIHTPTTTIPVVGSLYIHADVNSIYTTGDFVFLGTSDALQEFKTIDISSSTLPALIPSASFNLPFPVTSLDYEKGFLYGALRGVDGIRIFSTP